MNKFEKLLRETPKYYKTHRRGIMRNRRFGSGCAYRNKNGARCSIGRLFSDEASKDIQKYANEDMTPYDLYNVAIGKCIIEGGLAPSTKKEIIDLVDKYDWSKVTLDEGVRNLLGDSPTRFEFLEVLQGFHDVDEHWEASGRGHTLTEDGKARFNELLEIVQGVKKIS
jgi:hypothetical protein